MTLYQSDVLELLEAIRAGGDIDAIRRGAELVYQALIEAEATEEIGAGPLRTHRGAGRPSATGTVHGCSRPRPATSS